MSNCAYKIVFTPDSNKDVEPNNDSAIEILVTPSGIYYKEVNDTTTTGYEPETLLLTCDKHVKEPKYFTIAKKLYRVTPEESFIIYELSNFKYPLDLQKHIRIPTDESNNGFELTTSNSYPCKKIVFQLIRPINL
jgi:hypothetical protein